MKSLNVKILSMRSPIMRSTIMKSLIMRSSIMRSPNGHNYGKLIILRENFNKNQINFDEIIAEPEGYHSSKYIWHLSNEVYRYLQKSREIQNFSNFFQIFQRYHVPSFLVNIRRAISCFLGSHIWNVFYFLNIKFLYTVFSNVSHVFKGIFGWNVRLRT